MRQSSPGSAWGLAPPSPSNEHPYSYFYTFFNFYCDLIYNNTGFSLISSFPKA